MEFIAEATAHLPTVRAEPFGMLIVDFARKVGAKTIVKGLRAISDFEYEFEMHQLNRMQAPDVDTVYVMAGPQYSFLSSKWRKRARHLRRTHRGPRFAHSCGPVEGRALSPPGVKESPIPMTQ